MLIRGKAYWAKVLGEPLRNDNYPENPRQWSVDVAVDAKTLETLKEAGLFGKIKNKGDERGSFITFKRKEFKSGGTTANQAIKIVDHHGNAWDKRKLIGNGSEVNVRFNIYEDRRGGKNPAILAIQVWDLVTYEAPNREDFPVKDTEGDAGEPDSETF